MDNNRGVRFQIHVLIRISIQSTVNKYHLSLFQPDLQLPFQYFYWILLWVLLFVGTLVSSSITTTSLLPPTSNVTTCKFVDYCLTWTDKLKRGITSSCYFIITAWGYYAIIIIIIVVIMEEIVWWELCHRQCFPWFQINHSMFSLVSDLFFAVGGGWHDIIVTDEGYAWWVCCAWNNMPLLNKGNNVGYVVDAASKSQIWVVGSKFPHEIEK